MTLDDVQELMETLYGEADRERGQAATVAWLCVQLLKEEASWGVMKMATGQELMRFTWQHSFLPLVRRGDG